MCRSFDIVLSFIFQALFLKNEHIVWTSIVGACLVGLAILISAANKMIEKRKQAKQEKENSKIIKSSDVESSTSGSSSPDLNKTMDTNSKPAKF